MINLINFGGRAVLHPSPRARRGIVATLAATAILVALAACSSNASTRAGAADGPSTTVVAVTAPASIPAGTTLRIGDQLDYLKTVLELAGQDKGLPYKIDYSAFIGGPPMLQAFQAG